MIRISIGNIGSGKTASEVREIMMRQRSVYTNIKLPKIKHAKLIDSSMICMKEVSGQKKTRDGFKNIYDLKLNIDFWKSVPKPLDVVLDEAHAIINARRFMSKGNRVVTDWLALLRRVLGSTDNAGDLVLITQLPNRIDSIARDMAHQIRYHVCHYKKQCKSCGAAWQENSDMPETMICCKYCGSYHMDKYNHIIEIKKFSSMSNYTMWKEFGQKTYYAHYLIKDIETIFDKYDTLQWDNMFSDIYD